MPTLLVFMLNCMRIEMSVHIILQVKFRIFYIMNALSIQNIEK